MLMSAAARSNAVRTPRCCAGGFSLVEVMVALVVLSVGLLGIARMHSLALSSTTVASQRSLAAIEADSLAAMMHENRGYWSGGDPSTSTITIQGTTLTFTGAPLLSGAGTPNCTSTATPQCTPTALAAYDLQSWATQLQAVLPGASTTIKCGQVNPVSCLVSIYWVENAVAINSQGVVSPAAPATMQTPTYTLYVQP
jgi:type IV pilus assembly protein PilV